MVSARVLASVLALASPSTLLDLDARRRVYEYVTSYPGMHLREIGRATELEPNHAKYHLSYLERHGLVSSRRGDGYWRFWPKQEGTTGWREEIPHEHKDILAQLRRPAALHVALLLLDQQEMTHGDLQARVGLSHSTLHYHMQRLATTGLVVSVRLGRERRYRLNDPDLVIQLLQRYRPPEALVLGCIEAWTRLGLAPAAPAA